MFRKFLRIQLFSAPLLAIFLGKKTAANYLDKATIRLVADMFAMKRIKNSSLFAMAPKTLAVTASAAAPAPQGEAPTVAQGDSFSLKGDFLGDEVKRARGGLQQGTVNMDLHAQGDIGREEPLRANFHPEQAQVLALDGKHQER